MNTSPVPLLPRADVSTGALAGALIGLLMLFITESATAAAVRSFAVVIVQFVIEYFWPTMKVLAAGIADAIVVVLTGLYSLWTGLPLNEAAFQTAGVYLVTLVLTFLVPASQPSSKRISEVRC